MNEPPPPDPDTNRVGFEMEAPLGIAVVALGLAFFLGSECRLQVEVNQESEDMEIAELESELENAHGGQNTGDIEYASARLEEARAELRSTRDTVFRRLFDFVHDEMGCYVQQDAHVHYPHTPWCVLDVDGEVVARGKTPFEAMEEAQRVAENAD